MSDAGTADAWRSRHCHTGNHDPCRAWRSCKCRCHRGAVIRAKLRKITAESRTDECPF